MSRLIKFIITMSFFPMSLMAQEDIDISGKVTDMDGKAISGAEVSLEKAKVTATTDSTGAFSLTKAASIHSFKEGIAPLQFRAAIHNGFLAIDIPKASVVTIQAVSPDGRTIFSEVTYNLTIGSHLVELSSSGTGLFIYKVKSEKNEIVLKNGSIGNEPRNALKNPNFSHSALAKQANAAAAFADVLRVTKDGYDDYSMTIDNAKKNGLTIQLKAKNANPTEAAMIGWASVKECGENGTTGGGSGEPAITVNNTSELISALNSVGPKVILVSGKMNAPGMITDVKDKTLIGTNNAELAGSFILMGSSNMIFKNILFKNYSKDKADTFELSGCTCVWYDHCEFVDGTDGNLDIVRASDLVTVSWCKFYYTFGHNHMVSNLCGNGNNRDGDIGKINITFHYNWWGAGVRSRAPRVRYGKVHVFNNYYKFVNIPNGGGDNSKVAAGQHSKLLVENNYFEDVKIPMGWNGDGGTAEMVHRGNVFVNTGRKGVSRGLSFTPPYEYKHVMVDANLVKELVMKNSGRR